MAADDFYYANQNQFANEIIDATLEELREQRDEAQQATFSGSIVFDAREFATKTTIVQGPIMFDSPFHSKPSLTFGQGLDTEPVVLDSFVPVLVQPFRLKWEINGGAFAGFYVGLYALTKPPALPARHFIDWQATGEASPYRDDEGTEESWESTYNENEAAYLEGESADYEVQSE